MLELGEFIPSFQLYNSEGNLIEINREDAEYSYRLIYFYPKNGTRKCTEQACSLNFNFEKLQELDCKIIGISGDSISSHEQFAARHELKFTLLSDPKGEVRKQFDAKFFFNLLPGRVTYLVDRSGKILYSNRSLLNLDQHIDGILNFIKQQS